MEKDYSLSLKFDFAAGGPVPFWRNFDFLTFILS